MVRADIDTAPRASAFDARSWIAEPRSWKGGGPARTGGPTRIFQLDAAASARAGRLPPLPPRAPHPNEDPGFWEMHGGLRLWRVLGERAADLALLLKSSEVTVLRGFAPERDPGPAAYEDSCDPARIADTLWRVMGAIRLMSANAFAFGDENQGRLLRHVVARPGARREVSSQGWNRDLPWHMDGAFRPFCSNEAMAAPARWLVFGVINANSSVPMVVTSTAEAVRRLSPAARLALGRPEFAISTPDAVENRRIAQPLPILDRDPHGRLVSRLSIGLSEGLTPAARQALAEFEAVLAAPDLAHEIPVTPGDLVVLDNWRILHRRSAYRPSWDGADRWMVRVYASPISRNPAGIDARRLRP